MALTKADALARLRQRLYDTGASNYAYSDALLYTYLQDALKEIGAACRDIDPDYFLTSVTVTAFTDALDPANASDPAGLTGRYEFYPLPPHASIRWIERHDGSLHYKLWSCDPRDQEEQRYAGLFAGTAVVGSESFIIPTIGTYGPESAAIYADRFRVVPPPTAADGRMWRVFYDASLVVPDATNAVLPIPEMFEKPVIDIARYLALSDDGDKDMKAEAEEQVYGVPGTPNIGSLAKAVKAQRNRTRRNFTLRPTI